MSKSYRRGAETVPVLRDADLSVERGEFVALIGRSGSGKSTLLSLSAGIDLADSGRIEVAGRDLAAMGVDDRAALRRRAIGFVFQSFHLLPGLTALENAAMPLVLDRVADAEARATELLATVGLGAHLGRHPFQLSGGEMQRVAIARALANRPTLILADEPTGNLDSGSAELVMDLLVEQCARSGASLVLVTHDPAIAACASRIVELADGRVG